MKEIHPILADLKQDIAGPVPVELIREWVESDQTDEDHERILEPYRVHGTIVSSDASGLSRLSAGRSLIEVMKLVSDPKELVFSYGKQIGGRAVGVWAADNTQMFYKKDIPVHHIVQQMAEVQKLLQEKDEVRIGMGMHKGIAYEIGGGLYGVEADAIEEYTEDESNADEILLSKKTYEEMERLVPVQSERDGMVVLDYAKVNSEHGKHEDVYYPAPFDRAFHDSLISLNIENDSEVGQLHNDRVQEASVVLFRTFLDQEKRLLDRLTDQAIVNTLVHSVARTYDAKIVKSNGMLAIATSTKVGEGADLAVALADAAKKADIQANVGVSRGEVLVFDLEDGTADLAGGPVNLSSKLAEDTDERGKIYLEGVEAEHAKRHGLTNAFEREVSGIVIQGISS